jgi:hypothetical protein
MRFFTAFENIAGNSGKKVENMNSKRKRKSIIKQLYYGGLSPADKGPLSNPDLLAAMNAVADGEDNLEQLLEGETKQQFQQLCEDYAELTKLTGEERFIDGFKLAMSLACESLADSG